ncbi:undecaprenyl-diphosphate phosphatase [Acidobacteria bacterium AH-259-L09]|nr:undecaprenyl-diphosphate phosphatase [Acidobacteria bacterium AH-259-L09]
MLASRSLQAIFLGILQGATEFLPISSSAHLIVLPRFLGWESMGLSFDVMLHGGTLLALLIYFRQEWMVITQQMLSRFSRTSSADQARLLGALVVGTIPALLMGALFENVIEHRLRTPLVTVLTLSGFGLFLWWADRTGSQARKLESIRRRDGLIIGTAQALALIPGVSRSGVTITMALILGLSRADSARFSFLLGTPIIALATLARLYRLWHSQLCDFSSVVPLLIGVIFSFISGFLCIKYFLRFLQTRTYLPFVVYRLLLAAFIFVLLVLYA